jgi:transmembrane sensor
MRPEPLDIPTTPEEVAARWFALKRSGDMTAREVTELQLWLDDDPRHEEILRRMEEVWRRAREVRDAPSMMALLEQERRTARGRRPKGPQFWAALAASVAVVVTGGTLAAFGWFGDMPWVAEGAEQEFRTGVGQTTTISLDDGTVVTLDTGTVLRARETGRARRVTLDKGRAFFRVAKDASRPFVVTASGKTITAVGTAFDVRLDPGQLQVTLVEGRVAVEGARGQSWKGQSANMTPGWRLVARDDQRWIVSRIDLAKETSWLNGRLFFNDEPLAAVAGELNRYSVRKIVIRDPAIAQTPVLGGFRAGDVDDFVRVVEAYNFARVVGETPEQIELGAPRKKVRR